MKTWFMLVLAAILAASVADASQTVNFPGTPLPAEMYFTTSNSSANTFRTLLTATGVTDCNSFVASNNDSVSHVITLQIYPSAAVAPSLSISVTVNALSTSPLFGDAIATGFAQDQNQNRYVRIGTGDTIQVAYATALSAGATVGVIANCSTGYN